jgi:hypothetical protein
LKKEKKMVESVVSVRPLAERQNGDGQPRHKRTTYEEYRLKCGITDSLPPAVEMEKLTKMFSCFAVNATRIFDNCCDREMRDERIADPSDENTTQAKKLTMGLCAQEAGHVFHLLEQCLTDMRAKHAQVGGTSLAFSQCVANFSDIKTRFFGSAEVIEETARMASPLPNGLFATSLKIASYAFFAMFTAAIESLMDFSEMVAV